MKSMTAIIVVVKDGTDMFKVGDTVKILSSKNESLESISKLIGNTGIIKRVETEFNCYVYYVENIDLNGYGYFIDKELEYVK